MLKSRCELSLVLLLCSSPDHVLSAYELYEACTPTGSQPDGASNESKFSAMFEKLEGIASQKGGKLFDSAKQPISNFRKAFKLDKDARPRKPSADAMCKQFKETMSRPDVRVHFVGAW
jgi:hypothetical protein